MQGPLDNKVSVMKPTTLPERTDIELPFKFCFTLEVIVLTKFSQLQNSHQLLYKGRKIKGQVFSVSLKKKKKRTEQPSYLTHKIRRARWIWNDHWWYQLSGLVHPLRKVTLAFLEIFFLEFWALVFQWFKTWMSWANAKHWFASNDNIQNPNYWMTSLTPFLCLQVICASSVLLFATFMFV